LMTNVSAGYEAVFGLKEPDETGIEAKLNLNEGSVTGYKVTVEDVEIEIFKGIPYGKKPARFEPPEPIEKFDEPIKATKSAPSCYQMTNLWEFDEMIKNEMMSEDCLTIDIYKPVNSKNSAILFFVPGGYDFATGDSLTFNGLEQASNGNIVVIVQYRLGIFGFGTNKAEGGNYGLMDIKTALQFVKRNGKNLAGNDPKIAVNGHGGGASLVSILLMDQKFASMANQAILQSGSLLNAFSKNMRQFANSVEFLNFASPDFNTLDSNGKMELLAKMDPTELWKKFEDSKYELGPVPSDGILFKEDVLASFKNGNINKNFDLLITTTSYEGSVLSIFGQDYDIWKNLFPEKVPENFPDKVSYVVDYLFQNLIRTKNSFHSIQIARKYVYEFKQHKSSADDLTKHQVIFIAEQVFGDFQIRIPAEEEARIYSQNGVTVRKLHLDFDGQTKLRGIESCCGVSHGKELVYQFGTTRDSEMYRNITGKGKREKWEMKLTMLLASKFGTIIRGQVPDRWPAYTVKTPVQVVVAVKDERLDLAIETAGNTYRSKQAINYWKSITDNTHTEL